MNKEINKLLKNILEEIVEYVDKQKELLEAKGRLLFIVNKLGGVGRYVFAGLLFYLSIKLISGSITLDSELYTFNYVYGAIFFFLAFYVVTIKFLKRGKLHRKIRDLELRIEFMDNHVDELDERIEKLESD